MIYVDGPGTLASPEAFRGNTDSLIPRRIRPMVLNAPDDMARHIRHQDSDLPWYGNALPLQETRQLEPAGALTAMPITAENRWK